MCFKIKKLIVVVLLLQSAGLIIAQEKRQLKNFNNQSNNYDNEISFIEKKILSDSKPDLSIIVDYSKKINPVSTHIFGINSTTGPIYETARPERFDMNTLESFFKVELKRINYITSTISSRIYFKKKYHFESNGWETTIKPLLNLADRGSITLKGERIIFRFNILFDMIYFLGIIALTLALVIMSYLRLKQFSQLFLMSKKSSIQNKRM